MGFVVETLLFFRCDGGFCWKVGYRWLFELNVCACDASYCSL